MSLKRTALQIFFIVITTCSAIAQKQIDYQSDWGERRPSFPDCLILKSNVVFVHQDMTMSCDSAVFNTKDNFIEAFGNIHLWQDTIDLYGDQVYYDGNTKTAEIFGKVVTLQDGAMTLQTDYIVWEREAQTVRYTNSADIWNEESTLKSLMGTYYTDTKIIEFTDRVRISSPNADIQSDSLMYDTKTDWAYFYSPTNITTSDSLVILTERGNFNTKTNQAVLYQNNILQQKAQTLIADSIDYNTETECGKAFGNVFISDTANDLRAYSNYLETDRKDSLKYAFLTDKVLVEQIDGTDTLFLHSDTLWVNFDKADKAEQILAYRHVKMFRYDMQAVCDFVCYQVKDSMAYLLDRSVLWQQESQFTADTICIYTDKKGIKSMLLYPNPLIIQNSDSTTNLYYNQISGKRLFARFNKNKISFAQIDDNVNIIYHVWEEKKDKPKQYTGINIGSCNSLKLYFEKAKPQKMTAVGSPDFYIDDFERVEEKDRTLKGFAWFEKIRPQNKEDIFIHRD